MRDTKYQNCQATNTQDSSTFIIQVQSNPLDTKGTELCVHIMEVSTAVACESIWFFRFLFHPQERKKLDVPQASIAQEEIKRLFFGGRHYMNENQLTQKPPGIKYASHLLQI